MKSKENLVFLGMMGSGKTSVGLIVSKKLKSNFFDIDEEIEKDNGITISKIFETIKPTDVFPEPIIPKKTRFSFNFISFYIEKSQICLNLKIINDICNL